MIERFDRNHRVMVVPFQKPGLLDRLGLTITDCERMAWAVTTDLLKFGGAVNMAGAVALGTRLPLWIYSLPGVCRLQDLIYDWVVRNRHLLPGDVPYCVEFPQECG